MKPGDCSFWILLHARSANPNGIVSSSPGLRGTSYPGFGERERPNPNGVASRTSRRRRNRVAVDDHSATVSQGGSFVATLGFAPESRWDSSSEFPTGMMSSPHSLRRAGAAIHVAQIFNLLFRRLPVGKPLPVPEPSNVRRVCGLQTRDTAD